MSNAKAAKCPVCGWDIVDGREVRVGGRTVTVCSDECVREATADPSKLAGAR